MPTLDNSVCMKCNAADEVAVNDALSCFFGDPAHSDELTIGLCPDNVNPENATPTAWGGAIWMDNVSANALKDWRTGTLPTLQPDGDPIDWIGYGLTEAQALAAGALLTIQILVGAGDSTPTTNFNSLMSSLSLQKVVIPI
jgi:hypothetical protein